MMRILDTFNIAEDEPIQSKMISNSIENAQKTIEGKNFGIRKHVLEYDDVMNKQREVMYAERMNVIKAENVHDQVLKLIPAYVEETIKMSADNANKPDTWDMEALNKNIEQRLLPQGSEWITREKLDNWDYEFILEKLISATIDAYEEKIENYREQGFNYLDLEKYIFLRNVDTKWIDHIDSMDQLRKGISLRAYGHVDPVVEYKNESLDMFEDLTYSIQNDTVKILLKAELKKVPVKKEENTNLITNETEGVKRPVKAKGKIGRNDPCPCGSGKKYKDCCGKN